MSAVYNQFVAYWNAFNADINAIDQLPPAQRNQPNVMADRATIISLQDPLYAVYQQDLNAPLAQFQQDCAQINARALAAFNNAMGNNPIQQQIQADYTTAQALCTSLGTSLGTDKNTLNSYAALQSTIAGLQTQINSLPPGPQRNKAQSDLGIAQEGLTIFASAISSAQPTFNNLQLRLDQINTPTTGTLAQLQALAALQNPTQDDLTLANQLLATIQSLQTDLQAFESSRGLMGIVNSDLAMVNSEIQAVQNDIRPTPPPGRIEHACWYIDWTTWDNFPIPQGVNTVNIFVGQIALDQSGNPTINGFGDMSIPQINAFAADCQAKGIAVKVSIGGGGGSYDDCWDVLNSGNISAFAEMLVNFCHDNQLAGIDFDYEEFNAAQEPLVGSLIRQFKALDPALQASLCTNAGSSWQTDIKRILDASVDPITGKCPLDRLYIMSYYDSLSSEEAWIDNWAAWAQQNYGLTASQITVGIDDYDAHAYDIGAIAQFAGQRGYSTAHWADNPANQAASDQSNLTILNSYNSGRVKKSLTDSLIMALTLLPVIGLFVSFVIALLSKISNILHTPKSDPNRRTIDKLKARLHPFPAYRPAPYADQPPAYTPSPPPPWTPTPSAPPLFA